MAGGPCAGSSPGEINARPSERAPRWLGGLACRSTSTIALTGPAGSLSPVPSHLTYRFCSLPGGALDSSHTQGPLSLGASITSFRLPAFIKGPQWIYQFSAGLTTGPPPACLSNSMALPSPTLRADGKRRPRAASHGGVSIVAAMRLQQQLAAGSRQAQVRPCMLGSHPRLQCRHTPMTWQEPD